MGLQIRVRHPLGEQVIELPDRTAEQPITVGRSSGAAVKVPSVTVGPRHCALFVHEGRWVVQDLAAGGTSVNGKPVAGAARLAIGDVIQVGPAGSGATIEVDPAAAAAGRTGPAGGGALKPTKPTRPAPPTRAGPPAAARVVPPAAAAPAAAAAPSTPVPNAPGPVAPAPAAAPAYAPGHHSQPEHPQPEYPQPTYAQPQYAQPQYLPQYAPPQYPPPQYAPPPGGYAAPPTDYVPGFDAAALSAYAGPRKKRGGGGAAAFVMIVTAGAIGGVTWWAVTRVRSQQRVVIREPNQTIFIKADTQPATRPAPTQQAAPAPATAPATRPLESIVIDPNADPAATPPFAGSAGPASPGDPATQPATRPTTAGPAATDDTRPARVGGSGNTKGADTTGADGGMDMVRKPAGGAPEGMDVRKPAGDARPAGPDPESLDPAAARSWDTMKQLAARPGKESFAVLRFDEFRKANPGKHDAEIDAFIDGKMDRMWWERVDQLVRRIDHHSAAMPKIRLELADVNDPDVKKKMIESFKKMETELSQANKVLREQMGYADTKPPNLANPSELAAMAAKRDKTKYEGWKKTTLVQIRNNQGKLPWAGEM